MMVTEDRQTSFELQLVVIGILIPVYLSIIPILIKPILYFNLSMELPKIISYILGFSWFLCLLCGTYSLIDKKDFLQEKILNVYKILFKFNNRLTLLVLITICVMYVTFILSYLLSPLYVKYPLVSVFITILLVIILIILFVFKNNLFGGDKNVKK